MPPATSTGHASCWRAPGAISRLSGDDATALELMLLGGRGDISVTANVAPARMARMCAAALAGDAAARARSTPTLRRCTSALFVEPTRSRSSGRCCELGLIGPGIRLPLTPLVRPTRPWPPVRKALLDLGLLAACEA